MGRHHIKLLKESHDRRFAPKVGRKKEVGMLEPNQTLPPWGDSDGKLPTSH